MRGAWWIQGVLALLLLVQPSLVEAESGSESTNEGFEVSANITGELGFLDPLWHKVQFGRDGTYFDYVEEGGQDKLFAFQRLSADIGFGERHHAIFLYQPLRLETQVVLNRDVVVEGTTFSEGEAVDVLYGFPFFRASYLYDFAPSSRREIAGGVSLQLRNATINFTSVAGDKRVANRDVGPVPVLKFRTHLPLGNEFWFEGEADGFYAPIRYLNGDPESEAVGAIADISLRAGRRLSDKISGFVNLRYLGGGSTGENPDDADEPGGGYTKNWLHFATVSLGFSWEI
jgi:hypothetical protein